MVFELLRDLKVRVANMLARSVVRRVDDAKKMQLVQVGVLAGETRDGVERFQNYGFTSVPLAGAEAFAVFPGGVREGGVVLAVDDRRYRLKGLQAGEVAVYTDQGDKVVIERGGTIRVTASTKVVVAAPVVELAGNTEAAVKGTTFRSADAALSAAHTAFLTAFNTWAGLILPIAGPTAPQTAAMTAAIGALSAAVATYESAAAAALSVKVKLS